MTPATAELFRRTAEQAAKRGERVVGAYGSADGSHWRFDFARIGRKGREPAPAPAAELPRKVARGARVAPGPIPTRQGSLF